MEFEINKTYCELCLEKIDPAGLAYSDGYTICCNELPVNGREAARLSRENTEYDR